MKDFERGMMLLDMPPLTEICPDGAEALMDAIKKQSIRDYIKAKSFTMSRKPGVPYFAKALADALECRTFLGSAICNEIDGLLADGLREELYGQL